MPLANDPHFAALPLAARLALAAQMQALETRAQTAENKVQETELLLRLAREELRLLRMAKYGPKSEQLSDGQLALLELEPGVAAAEVAKEAACPEADKQVETAAQKPRRPHPGREALPSHLPRREEVRTVPDAQCQCAQCGQLTKVIGYDVSEELDFQPAEYFVRVTKREKRACPQCEEAGVQTAPLPPKIIEKGKASNRVIVDVLVKKYGDHLPLYRQGAILERDWGVELSQATLGGWVMQAGVWCMALAGALRPELLAGTYVQADETTVAVQSAETKRRNHQAYLWQYSRPDGPVVFDFQMGRGREGPRKFLGLFAGVLQCDGFAAYDKLGGPGLVYAGCWAHVRRRFVDALKLDPQDRAVSEIITEIGKLYAIEKQAREAGAGAAERAQLRQAQSVPQLAIIQEKIIKLRQKVLPQSAAGKACDYALGQWSRVEVYARPECGAVEIDNNWCENAMRPVAVGRKNWLHIGSAEAGPRVAAIASLIETCRRLDINPRDYLLDVLPLVPTWSSQRLAELTPARWKARQPPR